MQIEGLYIYDKGKGKIKMSDVTNVILFNTLGLTTLKFLYINIDILSLQTFICSVALLMAT